MILELEKSLGQAIRAVLKSEYDLDQVSIPLETPPDLKIGELATPVAFELARKLRKAPKVIAQEIISALGPLPGFASFEVAGAGYINAHLDRSAAFRPPPRARPSAPSNLHSLVEHTSINPNKAAHIGHLRNAILGDTFVRLLRAAGQKVDVQNYIDNTGVQVADVVVGFLHLEGKSVAEVRALITDREQRGQTNVADAFDYYCWDLYAQTSQWYTKRHRGREQGPQEAALSYAPPDRARRQRDRRDRRANLHGCPPPPSPDHAAPRHRVRFPPPRERNPSPQVLGCRLQAAQGNRRPLLRKRRQEQRLLGDDPPRRATARRRRPMKTPR